MPDASTPGLDIIANWQTLVFALAVYVASFTTRSGVQVFWKSWKTSLVYNEFVLHVLPMAMGLTLAIVLHFTKFPWPDPLMGAMSSQVLYGIAVGLFSGFVYGRIRKVMGAMPGGGTVTDAGSPPPGE